MKNLFTALLVCLALFLSFSQDFSVFSYAKLNYECNFHTPKCKTWKEHKAKIMKLPGGGVCDSILN